MNETMPDHDVTGAISGGLFNALMAETYQAEWSTPPILPVEAVHRPRQKE